MVVDFLTGLGVWNWFVLGLALLILELLAPGFFFVWFGVAALVTGAVALPLAASFGWQAQTLLFLVLAVLAVMAGRRLFNRPADSAEPLLNRRGEQLVGRRATLTEPIVNGRGRIRINDTTWRVRGPDLPAGTQVRVVSFDAESLEIQVEEEGSKAIGQ